MGIVGVVGFVVFEVFWRGRVEDGPEAAAAAIWLRHSDALKPEIGDVSSTELERSQTQFVTAFGSPNSGRFHFRVKGTKGETDVIVFWHDGGPGQAIVVDELRSLYDQQGGAIWKRTK